VRLFLAVALALVPGVAESQRSAPAPFTLESHPAEPLQGSLLQLFVSVPTPELATIVLGHLAGEPLHFEVDPNGGYRALGAVPLGATDSANIHLILIRGGIIETGRARLPVLPRRAGGERLRAPARFTPPPDSALQVRIDRERALARATYARAHEMPPLWRGPFRRPRDTRVTSPFGAGREVNGVWRSTHSGLDLAGPNGAPVRVAQRGVIALIGDFFYGGNSIYVYHGAGLMTMYQHLSRVHVAVGDTVARGQVIGRVGATGRVTGPHLHWEAHYGRVAFDPTDLLSLP
jgi:murein DD-endopeptidase MepM/ murein hydrolase activator NlpD